MPPPKRPRKNRLPPAPPSRTLHHWLATLIDTTRRAEDISRRHVAEYLDVDYATIRRFEQGHTWPKQIDQYLAAYAEMFGVGDPRHFYDWAFDLWRADGDRPVIERATPSSIELLEEAFRQPPQGRSASPHEPRQEPDANENSEADG